MTAYKIRKILLGCVEADKSLISSIQVNTESQLDLDRLLASLYAGDDLLLKVRELEALASCYQNLAGASHNQDIQELEHQILKIFQFSATSRISAEGVVDETTATFESIWLIESRCRTVADVLRVLNSILQISSRYIGPKIAKRIMADARPQAAWISEFMMEMDSFLTFQGNVHDTVSESELALIRDWVTLYIDSCTDILSNFRSLLAKDYTKP